ncbi:hypothetical protein CHUAL_005583 [Chamberlinius hualienensis]
MGASCSSEARGVRPPVDDAPLEDPKALEKSIAALSRMAVPLSVPQSEIDSKIHTVVVKTGVDVIENAAAEVEKKVHDEIRNYEELTDDSKLNSDALQAKEIFREMSKKLDETPLAEMKSTNETVEDENKAGEEKSDVPEETRGVSEEKIDEATKGMDSDNHPVIESAAANDNCLVPDGE